MGTWETQMDDYLKRKLSQGADIDDSLAMLKKSIAFAIMMKYKEKAYITEPYQTILFTGEKWNQYNSADWVTMFYDLIDEDAHIKLWRNQVLSLGVIFPLEYHPVTRQAYNWLYTKAEESGIITSANKLEIASKLKKLVLAYGGTAICNIFMKHEARINKEVLSWDTNYFFERLMYQVYKIEDLMRIKKAELHTTNPKLVRKV